MSVSKSKQQFQSLFKDKYGKNIQLTMEFEEQKEEPKFSDFNEKLLKTTGNKKGTE